MLSFYELAQHNYITLILLWGWDKSGYPEAHWSKLEHILTTIVQLAPAPARFAPAPVRAPLPLRFAPSPLRFAPAPVQARPAPQPIQAKSLYISHSMS